MKIPILSSALLIAALSLAPQQSAFGLSYSVEADGDVNVQSSLLIQQSDVFFTGELQQLSTSGSASVSIPNADASVNVAAAPGSLSGTTSASATVPADISVSSPFAQTHGHVFWQDQVTVTSATLADGTPVNLLLTQVLNATMTSAGFAGSELIYNVLADGGGVALGTIFANGELSIGSATVCSGLCAVSQSAIFPSAVGQTFDIRADMFLSSFAQDCPPTGPGCANAFAQLDAGHTGKLFLDPITTGASYTTASGTTYFSPVPEPSTILFLGFGLVGLAAWRWKRAA